MKKDWITTAKLYGLEIEVLDLIKNGSKGCSKKRKPTYKRACFIVCKRHGLEPAPSKAELEDLALEEVIRLAKVRWC